MTNRTSITERLKKSRNRQTRLDFAHEWADEWESKHVKIIDEIKDRVNSQIEDDPKLRNLFGDLHGLHKPKFDALHNIINELDTPTRELIE